LEEEAAALTAAGASARAAHAQGAGVPAEAAGAADRVVVADQGGGDYVDAADDAQAAADSTAARAAVVGFAGGRTVVARAAGAAGAADGLVVVHPALRQAVHQQLDPVGRGDVAVQLREDAAALRGPARAAVARRADVRPGVGVGRPRAADAA